MYVNGTLATALPLTGSINVTAGALRIGGNNIWSEWFNGLIDEVRIYNRALAQSEIQTRHEHAGELGGRTPRRPPSAR